MAAKRMIARGARPGSIVVLRLAYGDRVLESLREICREHKIRNGVILTGFGSLTDVAVSGAIGPSFPPRNFYRRTTPRGVEILAMSGVIANYHVHCTWCSPTGPARSADTWRKAVACCRWPRSR